MEARVRALSPADGTPCTVHKVKFYEQQALRVTSEKLRWLH